MWGAPAALCRPRPKMELLRPALLLLVPLSLGAQGCPAPLQCHGIGPLGSLNCSWWPAGTWGGPTWGGPTMLHLQSQKYHSNRTQTVVVPAQQSWVVVPREQLTSADRLLIWGTRAGRPLCPPVSVNLETQMKPDAPQLLPNVDFSEEEPLEAAVHWAPPTWPAHKVLICRFYYRRCRAVNWTLLEPELKTIPLSPVEIPDLALATAYEVSGRCRMEKEDDLWSEWSLPLSFQTPASAPKDIWLSGNFCETPSAQEALLLWKAPGPCVQVSYRVWFWVQEKTVTQEGVPCCTSSIPAGAEGATVSAVNATSWAPPTNLSWVCLAPESAPHSVVVGSIAGSTGLLVTWQQGAGEPREYVVDWARDGDPLDNLSWVRLPPGNLSALLPGNFEAGVPYRITVTAVSPGGLAPAPPVWGFREELAPLVGPALWRLPDDPPGTPAIAWGEVSRQQLRGRLAHYTLCAQSGGSPAVCVNVSGSTRTVTVPDLPRGSCELWVTASTLAGQGPPGPSLWLHLPDNTMKWKILPGVLCLWGFLLTACCLGLANTRRCLHLRQKVLPRWVWEKVPDPANSHSGQPHIQETLQPQPPGDFPILEVEEMEPPPVLDTPQASAPPHFGYEKHFLPTPEELGLLGPPRSQALA